jgi:hypothetical protein
MKTFTTPFTSLALAALVTLVTGCQTNTAGSAADSRVSVVFENPENFSDLKDDLQGSEIGRRRTEDLFRHMVSEEAARLLKEGQRLTLTFTDVDLAGDYLPSAPSGHDIRVVRAVYPPRMNFRYSLTDQNGNVIKEGEERLSDLAFQHNINPIGRDLELFHDRELFRTWARRTLR